MSNPAIAALIARRLPEGLPWPGDPANHQQPESLKLPGFNTTGMSPAQAEEFVGKLAQQFGEAVVNLIETDGGARIVASQPLGEAIADLIDMQGEARVWLVGEIVTLIDGKKKAAP